MANTISGRIELIGQTQTIAPKSQGQQPFIKREFVIRALRFNPDDGTPELSERNTPQIEFQGQDNVGILDQYKVGDAVKITFAVEGRSFERQDHTTGYANTIRAIRMERINVQLPAMQPAQQQAPAQAPQQQGQQVDYSQYQGPDAKPF